MVEWILVGFALSTGPHWHIVPIGAPPQKDPPGVTMQYFNIDSFKSEADCTAAMTKIKTLEEPMNNIIVLGTVSMVCVARPS